jgi:alcohol dehydrogenase class IV
MYSIVQPKVIHMGPGAVQTLGAEIAQRAPKKILIITDAALQRLGILDTALNAMGSYQDRVELFLNPRPDPDVTVVEECAYRVREGSFDLLIAIGGGSPLDVAKGASVLATHKEDIRSLLGRHLLKRRGLPTILVPTTSGTGTEVSQAAVMEVPEEGTKKSIWDPLIVSDVAIVDPELAILMPPLLTAETGLDALYHGIEGYTSRTSNPVTRMYCLEAIRLVAQYIKRAYNDAKNMEAREAMSRAATLAGIGFSNGGLGAIHGLALALDSSRGFSHGKGLAVLGPSVMNFNRLGYESLYATIAGALGESTHDHSIDKASRRACEAARKLAADVGISPYLVKHKISADEIPELAQRAFRLSQRLLPTNVREMTEEDVLKIFQNAYEEG